MNNLKYFRKKAGKTQKEIADLLHVTQTAYGHYEIGRRQISYDKLVLLSELYDTTIDDLMGRNESLEWKPIEEKPEIVVEEDVPIPLVASMHCGWNSSGEPLYVIKKVRIPASYVRRWGNDLKAIIAVGESMSPTIIPDDMLVCKPTDEWTDGNVVVVSINDTDTVKRIYRTSDGGIDLKADNPKYETLHFTPDDIERQNIHVLGRVLIPIPKEL